jgi:DNA repair protein SbcC/Rad50
MHGFAAFREPTEVDFTDAEYFALVGPTGAGKSTVIDAMTFALYGSVPRWDNVRTVSLALSPTANRGTVSLEFDVGRERYVVARELRRAASGSVSVRNARLERLLTTDAGTTDPDTEVLAHDGAVSKAVENLLGLPFEQFCVCVVLPQGDFAQFLHAKPADRQKTLTRILGMGMYEQMAREAGAEAKTQSQRAELLAEQLGDYADATEEAIAEAESYETRLRALSDRVAAALPGLAERETALDEAKRTVQRLSGERAALAALRPPDGLTELAGRARRVETELFHARQRLTLAEEADTEARRRLADAPEAEPLRRRRAAQTERSGLRQRLPELEDTWRGAIERTAEAERHAAEAEQELHRARTKRDAASAALTELRTEGERLAAERARLDQPHAPDGVAELDQRLADATEALAAARRELDAAESADRAARQALAEGPDRSALLAARRDHAELVEARRRRGTEAERVERDRERLRTADQELAEAERALAEQTASAQRADLVGALRPTLRLHQPCPVCAQPVSRLPDPPSESAEAAHAAGEHAVHAATERCERARVAQRAATEDYQRGQASVQALDTQLESLAARLAGIDVDRIDALLAEAQTLAATARAEQDRAGAARRARDAAERARESLAAEHTGAGARLRAARDPLVSLGAPALDATSSLADGWRLLTEWASEQVAARDARLTELRTDYAGARQAHTEAEQAHIAAQERLRTLRAAQTEAVRAEQDAAGARGSAMRRIAELDAELEGAPDEQTLDAQLAELERLAVEARSADSRLRDARAELTKATNAAERLNQDLERGWRALRAARDPLVSLGAPTGDRGVDVAGGSDDGGGDADRGDAGAGARLLAAWTELSSWAAEAERRRAAELAAAEQASQRAVAERARAEQELIDDLAAGGVQLPDGHPVANVAAPASAAALATATSARQRLLERRASAAKLAGERAEAEQAEQVARMLAGLLRSDAFPRWLVTSALDALVADASLGLAELSGGQFELTHADGEFLVIDHTDADARRPVKTLSGGETFQASLALALALSEQLSTLASAGAARLDSIFLDEGFGTLDEDNLEIVASTLENLAAQRDRMVGVITHVPALAERVPVRFEVSRTQQSSVIQRVSR